MSDGNAVNVSGRMLDDFEKALLGPRGSLDAWLECNDEAEVRAHILALIAEYAPDTGLLNGPNRSGGGA